jgi:diguanylate cyclase (GGDEF)-like protein/PAS domain S-box-containing protein
MSPREVAEDGRRHRSVPVGAIAVVSGMVLPVLGAAWRRARQRRRVDEIVHEAALGFAGADSAQAVVEVARRANDRLVTVSTGGEAKGQAAVATLEWAARRRLPVGSLVSAGTAASAALVEQATDVILVLDDDGRICFASPSSRALFGTSMLRDRAFLELVEPSDRRAASFLLQHVRGGSPTNDGQARADLTVLAAGGRKAQAELLCRDLRTDQAVRGLVLTLRDVTGRRQLEHELTRYLYWDPVAGLPNRVSFHEALSQALAADLRIAAVFLIDLRRFRMVNETFGRVIGDAVLNAVGQRLRTASGEQSLTARLGGDEFAVLYTDTDLDAVDETADRLMQALAQPVSVGDNVITVGVCMGIATTTEAETEQELLRHADLALDAAKAAGPGTSRRYDASMVEAVQYRLELRSALGEALNDGSLVLEYQPIISLQTGWTIGFEALVRWRHPTRGLLSPAEFIDIAEDSELIYAIGEYVLRTAIVAASRWTGPDPSASPYVSVNVSVRQFRAPGFLDTVRRILTESGLPANRLTLEITESLLLRDDDRTWDDLNRLRSWGVRIAIDDFGTGYSALGYLRQVPLDIVKVDRIFIGTIVTSRRQRDLVRGIVDLVRVLGLDVVAEGIETAGQRDICRAIGCAYGQGYLFARPMSLADTVAWLDRGLPVPIR